MKVTFFRSPFYRLIGPFKPIYHLGIGYMSAILKKHGHETELVDGEAFTYFHKQCISFLDNVKSYLLSSVVSKKGIKSLERLMEDENHDYWDQLAQKIVDTRPDIVAVTAYTEQITAVDIVTRKLKKMMPDIPIVLGGVHATALPKETLAELSGIDYIIAGEGEYRLLQLCEYLEKKQFHRIGEIDSLFSRDNGTISGKISKIFIENLDEIPFPDRTLGENEGYKRSSMSSVPIITGRGCPYNCSFCASKIIWDRRVRFRSIENVMAEILEISSRTGARKFNLIADTMTTNKKIFLEFCKFIQRNKERNLSFIVNSRVNELDHQVVEEMKKSGIDAIGLGIESGSQKILDRINKRITISQIKKSIELVNKYKIFCTCHFIIGHPGETENDVQQTINLAKEIASKYISLYINLATPYPGTELFRLSNEKGYKFRLNSYYKLYHQGKVIINLTDMSNQDLNYWYKKIQRLFGRHIIYGNLYRIQKIGLQRYFFKSKT